MVKPPWRVHHLNIYIIIVLLCLSIPHTLSQGSPTSTSSTNLQITTHGFTSIIPFSPTVFSFSVNQFVYYPDTPSAPFTSLFRIQFGYAVVSPVSNASDLRCQYLLQASYESLDVKFQPNTASASVQSLIPPPIECYQSNDEDPSIKDTILSSNERFVGILEPSSRCVAFEYTIRDDIQNLLQLPKDHSSNSSDASFITVFIFSQRATLLPDRPIRCRNGVITSTTTSLALGSQPSSSSSSLSLSSSSSTMQNTGDHRGDVSIHTPILILPLNLDSIPETPPESVLASKIFQQYTLLTIKFTTWSESTPPPNWEYGMSQHSAHLLSTQQVVHPRQSIHHTAWINKVMVQYDIPWQSDPVKTGDAERQTTSDDDNDVYAQESFDHDYIIPISLLSRLKAKNNEEEQQQEHNTLQSSRIMTLSTGYYTPRGYPQDSQIPIYNTPTDALFYYNMYYHYPRYLHHHLLQGVEKTPRLSTQSASASTVSTASAESSFYCTILRRVSTGNPPQLDQVHSNHSSDDITTPVVFPTTFLYANHPCRLIYNRNADRLTLFIAHPSKWVPQLPRSEQIGSFVVEFPLYIQLNLDQLDLPIPTATPMTMETIKGSVARYDTFLQFGEYASHMITGQPSQSQDESCKSNSHEQDANIATKCQDTIQSQWTESLVPIEFELSTIQENTRHDLYTYHDLVSLMTTNQLIKDFTTQFYHPKWSARLTFRSNNASITTPISRHTTPEELYIHLTIVLPPSTRENDTFHLYFTPVDPPFSMSTNGGRTFSHLNANAEHRGINPQTTNGSALVSSVDFIKLLQPVGNAQPLPNENGGGSGSGNGNGNGNGNQATSWRPLFYTDQGNTVTIDDPGASPGHEKPYLVLSYQSKAQTKTTALKTTVDGSHNTVEQLPQESSAPHDVPLPQTVDLVFQFLYREHNYEHIFINTPFDVEISLVNVNDQLNSTSSSSPSSSSSSSAAPPSILSPLFLPTTTRASPSTSILRYDHDPSLRLPIRTYYSTPKASASMSYNKTVIKTSFTVQPYNFHSVGEFAVLIALQEPIQHEVVPTASLYTLRHLGASSPQPPSPQQAGASSMNPSSMEILNPTQISSNVHGHSATYKVSPIPMMIDVDIPSLSTPSSDTASTPGSNGLLQNSPSLDLDDPLLPQLIQCKAIISHSEYKPLRIEYDQGIYAIIFHQSLRQNTKFIVLCDIYLNPTLLFDKHQLYYAVTPWNSVHNRPFTYHTIPLDIQGINEVYDAVEETHGNALLFLPRRVHQFQLVFYPYLYDLLHGGNITTTPPPSSDSDNDSDDSSTQDPPEPSSAEQGTSHIQPPYRAFYSLRELEFMMDDLIKSIIHCGGESLTERDLNRSNIIVSPILMDPNTPGVPLLDMPSLSSSIDQREITGVSIRFGIPIATSPSDKDSDDTDDADSNPSSYTSALSQLNEDEVKTIVQTVQTCLASSSSSSSSPSLSSLLDLFHSTASLMYHGITTSATLPSRSPSQTAYTFNFYEECMGWDAIGKPSCAKRPALTPCQVHSQCNQHENLACVSLHDDILSQLVLNMTINDETLKELKNSDHPSIHRILLAMLRSTKHTGGGGHQVDHDIMSIGVCLPIISQEYLPFAINNAYPTFSSCFTLLHSIAVILLCGFLFLVVFQIDLL